MPYLPENFIIRIAYADSDMLLQNLLTHQIDSFENCKVVIQAYSGIALMDELRRKPAIDLVIMDVSLPGLNGYDAAKKIRSEYPGIKILFLSHFENELVYCLLMDLKSNGFISKNLSPGDIKKAIYEVMKADNYFPHFPVSLKRLRMYNNDKKSNGHKMISDEEIMFLKLCGTNLTYPAIAGKMNIPARHGEHIRDCLFKKFDIHSRVELALFVHNSGIST